MVSAIRYQRIAAALLVIASASALVWFGNGLDPLWPLLWFAPLPVLVFALRSSWWSAALVAAFSWLIGGLNMWHYFHAIGMQFSVWMGIFSIVAVIFAAAVLLFRVLLWAREGPRRRAALPWGVSRAWQPADRIPFG